MKVQVNIKTLANKAATTKLELLVNESDTVASLKDRVSDVQLIPFPDQDLIFDGAVLEDSARFGDCCQKDGPLSMDLVIKASETTFVDQLRELLTARDLSCDELGLLYCYRHSVSVSQALQTLGCGDEKLQEFLRRQKCFQVEGNQIALVRESTALKPFSVAAEMEDILKASPTGSMEIKALCDKFTAKFNINLSSLISMKAVDFFSKDKGRFVVTGRKIVSLNRGQQQQPQKQSDAIAAVKTFLPPPPGLGPPLPARTENAWVVKTPETNLSGTDSQQYLDLHSNICGREFLAKVNQTMNQVIELVQGATFLNIDHVVRGGSIAKGTAIDSGVIDGDITFFLPGLPPNTQDRWLPHLVRSVGGVLEDALRDVDLIESVAVAAESVRLLVQGGISVELRFSPVFASYESAIQTLTQRAPEARKRFAPALSEERTQFIARQPTSVKITIRLLKWWRDQQSWSSDSMRPSDELLELVVVYSSVQSKPQDQQAAVVAALSLLARFDQLRVTWSNFYSRGDIPAAIIRQKPLLMDPVNPCCNLADPELFNPREVMAAARTTRFFA